MRIACIGPHNTGKTTFIRDFVKAYPKFTTPSYTYRDAVKDSGLAINQNTTTESQFLIFCELLHSTQGDEECILFDRIPFDAYIYSLGVVHKSVLDSMAKVALVDLKQYDAILYFPVQGNEHISLAEGGLRDTDAAFRDKVAKDYGVCVEYFRNCSSTYPKVITVTGDREARITQVSRELYV